VWVVKPLVVQFVEVLVVQTVVLVLRGCLTLVQIKLLGQVLYGLLILVKVLSALLVLAKVYLYWLFLCGYAV
jgi:hypothetical protein